MHAAMAVLRCFPPVPAHTCAGAGVSLCSGASRPRTPGPEGDGRSSLMSDECPQEGQLPLPAGEKLKPQGETPLQPPSKSQ